MVEKMVNAEVTELRKALKMSAASINFPAEVFLTILA